MFLKFNQYLFASFIFTTKISLGISFIYCFTSLLVLIVAGEKNLELGIFVVVMTMVFPFVAIASFLSFWCFLALRFLKPLGDLKKESLYVPAATVLICNGYLLVHYRDVPHWIFILVHFIVSVLGVEFGRRIYLKTMTRLIELQGQVGSSI